MENSPNISSKERVTMTFASVVQKRALEMSNVKHKALIDGLKQDVFRENGDNKMQYEL